VGKATHTRQKIRAQTRTQVTTRARNTTQRVLYSNGALLAITKNQMRGNRVLVLRDAQRMLGVLLQEPLEAIQEGKSCLLSGGAPDSPVHHRTSPVHSPVQIAFQIWRSRPLTIWSRWRTGQSGAPIRPLAQPRVTRGLRGRPLARPTVGSPDSLVNYSLRC
jgi:hypothetical protein